MVDFRQNSQKRKPPPNYLSRREQRRLLLMFGSLALIGFMTLQAAQPENWAWMWAGAARAVAPAGQNGNAPRFYDTRVRPTSPEQLPLDTFLAPAPQAAKVQVEGALFPGVDAQELKTVRDHTVARLAEKKSWFNLLSVLQKTDEADLRRASTARVGLIQLYEQPEVYRGKLVTIQGVAMRAFDLQAPSNDEGIKGYYQLWVNPEGGPTSPIVVYALELPDGFPSSRVPGSDAARNIHAPVEITGFFFKNWAYQANDTILSAPLVLARTVDWEKPVEVVAREPVSDTSLLAIVGVAGALAVGVAFWIFRSSRGQGTVSVSGLAARFQAELEARDAEEANSPAIALTLQALAEQAAAQPNTEQEAEQEQDQETETPRES